MRRRVGGYTEMGRPRIPPLPQHTVFTDRDDGTLWGLVHHLVDGFYHVGIDNGIVGRWTDYVLFGPYDGPRLASDPRARLLVRGGWLGYEYPPLPAGVSDIDQQRSLTRRSLDRRTFQIIMPQGLRPGIDALGYVEVEF